MNHPEPSQTFLKKIIFYFSVSALGKKTAEVAAEKRYIKLKMVVDEDKQQEIVETERQKEEVEREIKEVEREIKVKEKELERLLKEVDELQDELIMQVVRIESGGIKKNERAKVIDEQKKDEMRKLDMENVIDEKKEAINQLNMKRS